MMRKSLPLPSSLPISLKEAWTIRQDAKAVSNWIMGDLLGYLNANNLELIRGEDYRPRTGRDDRPDRRQGTISSKIAKTVFKEMLETGKLPQQIVEEQGLVQISDEGAIMRSSRSRRGQSAIRRRLQGRQEKAIGFLVGQVMKASKGKANPGLVNKLLAEVLNS